MYDYSNLEKLTNPTFKVRCFNASSPKECEELEDILQKALILKEIKLMNRKDYFNEKLGMLLVFLEWVEYDKEKQSPFTRHPLYENKGDE